jgi:hypothetical protein
MLCNTNVHYRVHKSRPLVHLISLISILTLSTYLRLGLPSGLLPSGFPTNILYACFSPVRATCPAYLMLLNLVILIIFDEEYKLRSPHYTVFCNLLSLNSSSVKIFSSAPCSQGARGSVVGSGTMLQAWRLWVRFPMRLLDFSFDLILLTAIWAWGRLNL